MICSVFLSGRTGKSIDERTRAVELDSIVPGSTGEFQTYDIPVRSNRGPSSHFLSAKEGALVTLQGRLEVDPLLGLIVQVEVEEIHVLPRSK